MNTLESVRQFYTATGSTVNDWPCVGYREINRLRVKLLREEVQELEDALDELSTVEVLDALTDIQYILDGTYLSLGLWKYKALAFAEVHRSNMTKFGYDGEPIRREDGKILKGPNYTPPDLDLVLKVNPDRQDVYNNMLSHDLLTRIFGLLHHVADDYNHPGEERVDNKGPLHKGVMLDCMIEDVARAMNEEPSNDIAATILNFLPTPLPPIKQFVFECENCHAKISVPYFAHMKPERLKAQKERLKLCPDCYEKDQEKSTDQIQDPN